MTKMILQFLDNGMVHISQFDGELADWCEKHGKLFTLTVGEAHGSRVDAHMSLSPKPKSTPVILDESETARIVEECAKRREQARIDLTKTHSDLIDLEMARALEDRGLHNPAFLHAYEQSLKVKAVLNTTVSEVMAKVEPTLKLIGGPLDGQTRPRHAGSCHQEYAPRDLSRPPSEWQCYVYNWSQLDLSEATYAFTSNPFDVTAEPEPPAMDVPGELKCVRCGKVVTATVNDICGDCIPKIGDRLDPPQELEPPKRVNWKEFLG